MRSLKNSKSLITFDNAQCRCFEAPIPTKQFFLSKNQIPKAPIFQKTINKIPEKIQQALTKTSLKRSLKQLGCSFRNGSEFSQQEPDMHENPNYQTQYPTENENTRIVRSQKVQPLAFHTTNFPPYAGTPNFKKPNESYSRPLVQYNSIQPQQKYLHINPQNFRPTSNQNIYPLKRVETSKINFNFNSNAPKQIQSPLLRNQISKTQSLKNFNQVAKPNAVQQIKIPKLDRKYSRVESTDLGVTQTLTKHSIINPVFMKEAQETQINEKSQIRETGAGFKDLKQTKIKNQSTKIIHTAKPKQNTYKSVINTKRSLVSQTTRSKIVTKKDKPKPVLNKMQDVEEIRSLADSDEQEESDKESVVLGRLNEYQSTTIMRTTTAQAQLQQSLHFIQSSNSIIMESPSTEWRYEAQSQRNY